MSDTYSWGGGGLGSWMADQLFLNPPPGMQPQLAPAPPQLPPAPPQLPPAPPQLPPQQQAQQEMPFLQPGRGVWPAEVYNNFRLQGQSRDQARQNTFDTMSNEAGWFHPGRAHPEDVQRYLSNEPMAAMKPRPSPYPAPGQPWPTPRGAPGPILPPLPWQPPDWA